MGNRSCAARAHIDKCGFNARQNAVWPQYNGAHPSAFALISCASRESACLRQCTPRDAWRGPPFACGCPGKPAVPLRTLACTRARSRSSLQTPCIPARWAARPRPAPNAEMGRWILEGDGDGGMRHVRFTSRLIMRDPDGSRGTWRRQAIACRGVQEEATSKAAPRASIHVLERAAYARACVCNAPERAAPSWPPPSRALSPRTRSSFCPTAR
jgi:hypothetical protein